LNDWGRKNNDHYDNIYSTSSALTSGGPNCTFTNVHVFPSANWPQEALSIIKNSGLDSAHLNLAAKMSIGIPAVGIQGRSSSRSLNSYNVSIVPNRSLNGFSLLNPDQHSISTMVYNTSGQRVYLGTATNAARMQIPLPPTNGMYLFVLNVDGSADQQARMIGL